MNYDVIKISIITTAIINSILPFVIAHPPKQLRSTLRIFSVVWKINLVLGNLVNLNLDKTCIFVCGRGILPCPFSECIIGMQFMIPVLVLLHPRVRSTQHCWANCVVKYMFIVAFYNCV